MMFGANCSQFCSQVFEAPGDGKSWAEAGDENTSTQNELMTNTTPIKKEEARRLVEELPEDATWSDFRPARDRAVGC
jgi:hypothetical protein